MMKKICFSIVIACLLTVLPIVSAQDELPAISDLNEGWNTLEPGGETICAYGTDYNFHVRTGNSDNLLIFFNGGGACWFGQICSPASPTFVPFADIDANIPAPTGIFDFTNEENPFTDYNMIFVPYCTGDVHLGNTTATYDIGDNEFIVHHKGYVNASTVLDWVFTNFESPASIFVAGSSAGSIAVPFYAGLIAEAYPNAQISALGDGSGGYRAPEATTTVNTAWDVLSILPEWEEYATATIENLNFESYYGRTSARFPQITFGQYNTANDETQYVFLGILGIENVQLLDLLTANYDDIRTEVEPFATYTAGGTLHTILRLPQFYSYEVDGVRVRDWVASLAAGDLPGDVMCVDCQNSPEYE